MNFVVEYLIVIPGDDTFCPTSKEFNQFLQVDSKIVITRGKLIYSDVGATFECAYDIQDGHVPDRRERYFRLNFEREIEESEFEPRLSLFTDMLRTVGTLIRKLAEKRVDLRPEILRDDISAYYAHKAYPLIYRTENLMRSLISSFMLVNVGSNWFNEATPRGLRSSSRAEARSSEDEQGNLYATNFIDLSRWLLNAYPSKTMDSFYAEIRQMKPLDQKNREALFSYVPQSNWERYFEAIVTCNAKDLKDWWDQLYNLRCIVAHNGLLTREEYGRIVELTARLDRTLTEAMAKLAKITVPPDEREDAANSGLRPNSALTQFLIELRDLEHALLEFAVAAGQDTMMKSTGSIVQDLVQSGLVEPHVETKLMAYEDTGRRVVLDPTSFAQGEIELLSSQMADLSRRFREQQLQIASRDL